MLLTFLYKKKYVWEHHCMSREYEKYTSELRRFISPIRTEFANDLIKWVPVSVRFRCKDRPGIGRIPGPTVRSHPVAAGGQRKSDCENTLIQNCWRESLCRIFLICLGEFWIFAPFWRLLEEFLNFVQNRPSEFHHSHVRGLQVRNTSWFSELRAWDSCVPIWVKRRVFSTVCDWRTKYWREKTCTHCAKTMATASLRTLSPNTNAYKSTSTFRSWNIANTVTENTQETLIITSPVKITLFDLQHLKDDSCFFFYWSLFSNWISEWFFKDHKKLGS